jgi:hypothetical protein
METKTLLDLIPFHKTYDAIKHGWPNPLFTKKEAIGYSLMYDWDISALYGLMAALAYKMIIG